MTSPASAVGWMEFLSPLNSPPAGPRCSGSGRSPTPLNDRFALLTIGRRTAVPRHRTLRATLDWSYELLPASERLLLRRLAVFPAGFTIDGAAAVMRECGLDMLAVVDGIANLVTKSLVPLDKSAAQTRWYLLETTRTCALEKLAAHGEAESAARCHAAYFRDLFASPVAGFRSRMSAEDLTLRGREIDNVRAALDWAFSVQGDDAIGIDLTADYAPIWMNLSLLAECRECCERALLSIDPTPPSHMRARMWVRIALASPMIFTMGPSERVRTLLVEAIAPADTLSDLDAEARALSIFVVLHDFRGDYDQSRIAVERLRQIAHRTGDLSMLIVADRSMGNRLVTAGRPREAQECLELAL